MPGGFQRAAGLEMTEAEAEAAKTTKDGGSKAKVRAEKYSDQPAATTAIQLASYYLLMVLQLRRLAIR